MTKDKSTDNSKKSLEEVRAYVRGRFMSYGKDYFDILTERKNCTSGTISAILNELGFDSNHCWQISLELKNSSQQQNGRMLRKILLTEYSGMNLYEPDADALIIRDGLGYLNLWRPLAYSPIKGDVAPFLSHLKLVLKDDFKVNFVLDFLAFRMQNPTEKAHQALYLYGKQGSGKGTLKNVMQDIFGESAVKYAGNSEAVKAVENWARTFFIVDEIEVKKSSSDYDRIKALIVEKSMEGRLLYQNYKTHKVMSQLIMFSNHSPNFLEKDDRRFFVAEWSMPYELDSKEHAQHFESYHKWIATGIPALGYFLLNRDLSQYKPYSAPPMTIEKKQALSLATDSQVEKVIDYLNDNPQQVLFTVEEIKRGIEASEYLKDSALQHSIIAAGMTKELEPITIDNKRYRVWIREGWEINRKTKPIAVINRFTRRSLTLKEASTAYKESEL
jgi:hypothetical protein